MVVEYVVTNQLMVVEYVVTNQLTTSCGCGVRCDKSTNDLMWLWSTLWQINFFILKNLDIKNKTKMKITQFIKNIEIYILLLLFTRTLMPTCKIKIALLLYRAVKHLETARNRAVKPLETAWNRAVKHLETACNRFKVYQCRETVALPWNTPSFWYQVFHDHETHCFIVIHPDSSCFVTMKHTVLFWFKAFHDHETEYFILIQHVSRCFLTMKQIVSLLIHPDLTCFITVSPVGTSIKRAGSKLKRGALIFQISYVTAYICYI